MGVFFKKKRVFNILCFKFALKNESRIVLEYLTRTGSRLNLDEDFYDII